MLITTKSMKEKYEQIQNCLFETIPEKWEEIYLYASVIDIKTRLTGELYFYYLPKGLLKKKYINVYEVPSRFNIEEREYIKLIERIYNIIKDLRQEFINSNQKIWTNLTITISNCKFKVEYGYEKIKLTDEESKKRHIIWKYKYMGLGGEFKEERKILDEYFSKEFILEPKKQSFESGIYIKKVNNIIDFEKEESYNTRKTYNKSISVENEDKTENIILTRLYHNQDINKKIQKKEGSNKQ